jgi:hypothetical protein
LRGPAQDQRHGLAGGKAGAFAAQSAERAVEPAVVARARRIRAVLELVLRVEMRTLAVARVRGVQDREFLLRP